MMNNPLVSIIMPAYNVEKYIASAIESVIHQTYQVWELLIIDDGSSDHTRDIILLYAQQDSRIKPFFHAENSGKPSIAKNTAIEHVRGSYVAFLDSDDLWIEDKLEKQILFLEKNTFMLCYTGGYYIDEDDVILKEFLPQYPDGYILKYLLCRYELNNQSVVLKTEVLQKFNEAIIIGEDYNLFMHIAAQYPLCSLKEKLIKYRVNKYSITKHKEHDLSQGVLITLHELHQSYAIKYKFPLCSMVCWLNAMRHKINYILKKYKL